MHANVGTTTIKSLPRAQIVYEPVKYFGEFAYFMVDHLVEILLPPSRFSAMD